MEEDTPVAKKNTNLVKWLAVVVIGMFGFGYALVPLYDVLCDLTGLNGKGAATASKQADYKVDNTREIEIEFFTTLNKAMPMAFTAETKQLKIHPGQYYTVNFKAENKTGKAIVAQAIPSFSPGLAAKYFEKVECFCFQQQHFKPGEIKVMPMRFVVKPDVPEDFNTISLSYTFFDNSNSAVQR